MSYEIHEAWGFSEIGIGHSALDSTVKENVFHLSVTTTLDLVQYIGRRAQDTFGRFFSAPSDLGTMRIGV